LTVGHENIPKLKVEPNMDLSIADSISIKSDDDDLRNSTFYGF